MRNSEAAGPEGPTLKAPLDIDFDSLRSINTDVIGWIYVEALDGVSYPVVKGTDNEQYLHMTYEKNYNLPERFSLIMKIKRISATATHWCMDII